MGSSAESDKRALEAQLARAKEDKQHVDSELRRQTDEKEQQTAEALRFKLDADTTKAALESARGENDRLKQQLVTAQSQAAEKSSVDDGGAAAARESQSTITRLLEEHSKALEAKSTALLAAKTDLIVLQNKLDAVAVEKERVARELTTVRDAGARQQTEADTAAAALKERLEAKDASHRAALQKAQDDLLDTRQRLEAERRQLEERHTKALHDEKTVLSRMELDKHKLEFEVQAGKDKLKSALADVARLSAQKFTINSASSSTPTADTQASVDAARRELQGQIDRLRDDAQKTQQVHSEQVLGLRSEAFEMQHQVREGQAEKERADTLQEERRALRDEKSALEQAAVVLKGRVRELEDHVSRLSRAESDLADARSEGLQLRAQIDELKKLEVASEISTLTLEARGSEIRKLEAALEAERKTVLELNGQVTN
jgi:hypothetical protein